MKLHATSETLELRVLLTGGAGFLGRAILRELAQARLAEVRVFDLLEADSGEFPGVAWQVGDIRDADAVHEACRGVDVVLHAASQIDWGHATPDQLAEVNVGGTENVLRACLETRVRALVYTSSMDAVCGTSPIVQADETLAYPRRFANEYARTKALAEQAVIRANAPGLRTCALRPCGMFGEGDPYHVAHVLRVVKAGNLPFRIGDGRAAFQHVYVGNVAHAHLLAMRALLEPDSRVAGEIYFITDDSPAVNFFDFMEPILNELGYTLPPKSRSVPYPVMWTIGALLEGFALACRPVVRFVPTLTRSSVRFVGHDHTFVGEKARRHFGYEPIYSESQAI
ncbi:MAG: NAD-dependent epimerase/dehydratase family protein, partial [Myxococcota bacterium]